MERCLVRAVRHRIGGVRLVLQNPRHHHVERCRSRGHPEEQRKVFADGQLDPLHRTPATRVNYCLARTKHKKQCTHKLFAYERGWNFGCAGVRTVFGISAQVVQIPVEGRTLRQQCHVLPELAVEQAGRVQGGSDVQDVVPVMVHVNQLQMRSRSCPLR